MEIAATIPRRGVMHWFARHPKTTIALLLLLVFTAAVFITDYLLSQRLVARIEAIRARGEPTSVEDLIALQTKLPDERNMIAQFAKYGELAQLKLPNEKLNLVPTFDGVCRVHTDAPLPVDQLEASRWFIQEIASDLHGMQRATALPRGPLNVAWSSPLQRPIPELTYIWYALRALCLKVTIAAEDGQREEAEGILLDLTQLRGWCGPDAPMIFGWVYINCITRVEDEIARTINRCGISNEVLRKLQIALQQDESGPSVRQFFVAERVWTLDAIWPSRQLPPIRSALIFPFESNYVTPLPILRSLDLLSAIEDFQRWIDALEDSVTATVLERFRTAVANARADRWNDRFIFIDLLAPSFEHFLVRTIRRHGRTRALITAIAAERYRLAKGKWPATLDDLVPDYLDAVPIDPIDGKPIRYAVIPEGIKTWTISGDNHDQDDGGDIGRLQPPKGDERHRDFGCLILNPDLRGKSR